MLSRLAPVAARSSAHGLLRPLSLRSISTAPIRAPLRAVPRPVVHHTGTNQVQQGQTRQTSSASGESGGLRISHLFLALAGGAILITTYGILEWYSSFRVWPESIRTPLKKAIKARNHGDTDKAEKHFLEAIAAAHALPPSALEPEPLQKMSGLYITMAAMLEGVQPIRAFVALRDAYGLFGSLEAGATSPYTKEVMSENDLTRAIGLAQKMGQIAARLGGAPSAPPFPSEATIREYEGREESLNESAAAKLLREQGGSEAGAITGKEARVAWDTAAETYLSAAVTAMLKMGLAHRNNPKPGGEEASKEGGDKPKGGGNGEQVIVGRDVRLPHDNGDGDTAGRVNRRGLGMAMETLAEVYGRRGRPDLAGQLILQAITTVIPPQAEPGTILPSDQCQAAMLMTSLSAYALAPRTAQAIKASRSWSLRALQEAEAATKAAGWATGLPTDVAQATCQRAGSVALFNLGMLAEMEKDDKTAAQYFNAALQAARDSGFGEGRREAAEALRRVKARKD